MSRQTTTLQEAESETTKTRDWDHRIGEKMKKVIRNIANNEPYPSKHKLAKLVGAHGSTQYGYQTVNRCITRELITTESDHPTASPRGDGAVVLTDKGREYAEFLGGEF